jgi:DNA repair protein RadC
MGEAGRALRQGPAPHHSGHAFMRSIPLSERPRERMEALGPGSLTVHELVAVLVGSGGRSGSALEVAERLLAGSDGSLRRLASLPPGALRRLSGVGSATATRLLAALELGRRSTVEPLPHRLRIRGPSDVHALMAPSLRDLQQEEFHIVMLNTQHRVLRTHLVTRGVLDASLVHPREVFRPAIQESAAALILVHNHPSGDPGPSPEDRAVTRHLAEAGTALGIHVLDHVIIGDGRWTSLAESGELDGAGVRGVR